MSNQHQKHNHTLKFHRRHFKPFWPMLVIAVLAFIVGGLVVWTLFNQGLEEDLYNIIPLQNFAKRRALSLSKPHTSTQAKEWKTYSSKEFGFEFKYDSEAWKVEKSADLEAMGGQRLNLVQITNESSGPGIKGVSIFKQNKKAIETISDIKSKNTVLGEEVFKSNNLFWQVLRVKTQKSGDSVSAFYYVAESQGISYIVLGSTQEENDLVNAMLSTFKFIKAPAIKLIQECPDQLVDDRTSLSGEYQQYYVYRASRYEINEFDASWLAKNCSVKKLIVY